MKEDIEADIYILEVWLQQIKSNKAMIQRCSVLTQT